MLTNYFQTIVGDLDAAQNAADDAVRLDPTNPLCWAQRSLQSFLTGATDHVLDDASRAFELAGDDPVARLFGYIMLGHLHLIRGETAEARRIASDFSEWARQLGWPRATAMALHLTGRLDIDEFPERSLAEFGEALRIAQSVESVGTELEIRREIAAVVMRWRPEDALPDVLDVLRRCRDHLSLVPAATVLGYSVTLLAHHGEPVLAATLLGNLRPMLLSAADHTRFEETARELRDTLGERYEDLTAAGGRRDRWRVLDDVIARLGELAAGSRSPANTSAT